MTNYGKHFTTLVTPQRAQARGDQLLNAAGGYAFVLDKWAKLDRFLILGCEGGTYYATEQKLTRDNAKNVQACLADTMRPVPVAAVRLDPEPVVPVAAAAASVRHSAIFATSDDEISRSPELVLKVSRSGDVPPMS